MSDAPDWFETPNVPLHDLRGQGTGTELTRPFTSQQLLEIGAELIEQFLKRVVQAVVGFFIPGGGTAFEQLADWAVENVLNIPLTALGAIIDLVGGGTLFSNLIPGLDASKIISGTFGLDFISGLLDGEGHILTDLLSIPAEIITGLPAAVASGMQSLIDMIVNALEGTPGHEGNPLTMVFSGLNGLRESLQGAHEVVDNLALYVQDMATMLVQIVQQATVRPVLGTIGQVWNALSFWIFGWFHRTEKAHTSENAAVATLRGEVNAKLASIATGTEGWVDDFDTPGYSLATNYTVLHAQVSSTLGTRGTDPNVVLLAPTGGARAGHVYNVEMTTGQVDLEMAISNLTSKGRALLWIGDTSNTLALGLATGTLVLRIDNQIGDPSKQRLQIYTVMNTGNLAQRGNLYSVDTGTWHDGDLLRLRRDETSQVYRAYLNNIEVCTFDDDALNIVPLGAGNRKVGWLQNLEQSVTDPGPDLDLIHAYDWTT